jgi:hypothetical protein
MVDQVAGCFKMAAAHRTRENLLLFLATTLFVIPACPKGTVTYVNDNTIGQKIQSSAYRVPEPVGKNTDKFFLLRKF